MAVGASTSKSGIGDKIYSWQQHHKLSALDSLERMLKSPTSSLMTWLVIGIALTAVALRSGRWSAAVGTWMGIMLCLYSLHDFRTDLWMYPEQTDAGLLARYWGLDFLAAPIAIFWVLISLSLMYRAMRHLVRHGGK